jgi:Xaa-Pro dipeptidase
MNYHELGDPFQLEHNLRVGNKPALGQGRVKDMQELAFSLAEYNERVSKVRDTMKQRGIDVFLIHSLPSIFYLTGFQTVATRAYACFVLPAEGECGIVLERDEQYNARQGAWVEDLFTYARWVDPIEVTVDAVKRLGLHGSRIGIECASRYLSSLHYLQLRDRLAPATLIDGSDIVLQRMLLKSQREIDYIRQAAAITVQGMRAAIDAVAVGRTDNDVASVAYQRLVAAGSEYMSSDPIVCAGENSAIPHGHYANRKILSGDVVLLEMSACVQRYSAPLMRAVSLGRPDPAVVAMEKSCRHALEDVIGHMGPGVAFSEVAKKGKAALEAAGPSMIFHGTYAYSMGLGFPGTSWADSPVEIRDDSSGTLEAGMVFHLPISLRDKGKSGVAYSETVVITDGGCEVLTEMDRELFLR